MDKERGLPSFPDNYFQLCICDPPYGIGADGNAASTGGHGGRKAHKKKQWDNGIPTKQYFEQIFRVSENQIIWGANYYPEFLHGSMGWVFWDKGQRIKNSDGELAFTSFNRALRVVEMNRCQLLVEGGTIHPTQKPIALYRWLLNNYAKPGMRLLDSHCGSASSLIAFEEQGFEYVAFEKDADYYRDSCKRLEQFRAQPKLFSPDEIWQTMVQGDLFGGAQ